MRRRISKTAAYMCIFTVFLYGLGGFAVAEEDEMLPEHVIRDLLKDESIPDDIKTELEKMYENGELDEELGIIEEGGPGEEVSRGGIPSPGDADASSLAAVKEPASDDSEGEGKKISLDLKGVDIIDVLKMLSTRSNLNIIAGRNVRGRVTLFLKDVDVWEAFEIILAANDLAYEKQGDIINVMTERDYQSLYGESYNNKKDIRIYRLEFAKVEEMSKALNQAKSKIGKVITDQGSNTLVIIDTPAVLSHMERMIAEMDAPVETKIFSLNYAKAEDVKTKISEMLTKTVGSIQVDERTNKVVITDLTGKMSELESVINEMDEKHREVLIEAKIVQISLDDEYKYGVDWKVLFHKIPDEGLRFNFDNLDNVFAGSATGGALTVGQFAHDYLDMAVEALQTVGKTNVISSPRITVLNNEEAKVLVGTEQPYIEQETVSTDATDRTNEIIKEKEVGVSLTVTPTINKEGFVTMKIKPKISSITDTLTGATARLNIPVVSTSETETTVMVKDGTTIVIAGLIEDRDEKTKDKIPVLGDIPLLGYLFKSESSGSTSLPEKKEIVIFLTPYIMNGTEMFPEVKNIWYEDKLEQDRLLDVPLSIARKEAEPHNLTREMAPEPEPEPDRTTRISEDLEWIALTEKEVQAEEEKRTEFPLEGAGTEEIIRAADSIPVDSRSKSPLSSSYYDYFVNLRNKIYWVAKDLYPVNYRGMKEDVVVLFKLASDGSLLSEPRVLNYVDQEFADAARSAVRLAAPFPAFPLRMEKDEEMFKITITYR